MMTINFKNEDYLPLANSAPQYIDLILKERIAIALERIENAIGGITSAIADNEGVSDTLANMCDHLDQIEGTLTSELSYIGSKIDGD